MHKYRTRSLYRLCVILLCCTLCTINVSGANEEKEDDLGAGDDESKDGTSPSEENGVLVLTKDNFDSVVYSKDVVLVEFYAPWCGHCKQLAPHFEKAAKRLKESTPPVILAKVDCTVEDELAKRFEVSGYPTLIYFKDGTPTEYDGGRDEEGIVDFMKERTDPSWKPPPSHVLVLTKDNFTEVVDGEELLIAMFYAPWCGHCKKMAPEYDKAAAELKKNGKSVVLAKIDATAETDLAKKYDVNGYPTMKVFRHGHAYKYNGETSSKNTIVDYVEKQLGPGSKAAPLSNEGVKKLVAKADLLVRIIAFFDSDKDDTYTVYMEAANDLRDDYQFSHTFSADVREAYKVKAGTVVVFIAERFQTPYEPKWHSLEMTSSTTTSEVASFIRTHDAPLVGEYNKQTETTVYQKKRPLVLFFYTVDWSFEHRDATQKWRTKFAQIAKKYSSMTFAIADEDINSELIKSFGFDDSGEEINVGIIGSGEKRYAMAPMEEYDSDEVISFINKYLKGSLKPKIRSAPAPKRQSGPVTIVVGSTFEKIVLDETKDVLIELYAPWCGHCKKLEPIYAELAKSLKKEKNLVIAKMDATANEAPDTYPSTGFPTIFFAPSGSKDKPISFKGDRTAEEMEKFIRDNAVVSMGKRKKTEL